MSLDKPQTLLAHFGLTSQPFSDSVNPDSFFKTETHEKAYLRARTAIEQHSSLVLITGRSGTGKTLLSQMLLKELPPERYKTVIVLVSPGMSKTALLSEIASEAGIMAPGTTGHAHTLIGLLSDHIIDLYHQRRKLVVLIDECHFLSAESLHTLRTLSNIEIPERKLLTAILFSEPRLLKRLQHPNYEALMGRIYMQAGLEPLSLAETIEYVKFRLLLAGGREDLFDESGLVAIHMCSAGICRLINKVCSCALLEAFVQGARTISLEPVAIGANRCMAELKTGLKPEA